MDGEGLAGVVAAPAATTAVAQAPRRRACVRFSAKLARRVCARVGSGESMVSICRDADMPSRSTLTVWARTLPRFGRALRRAQAMGGWSGVGSGRGAQPPSGYDEVAAREIFARLCEGEALTAICADPGMPGTSSVYRWRDAEPEFARMMTLARQVQAERFCDLGWEIASAVTPGDAYATHVKLMQLRWTAAALAPRRFGRLKPVEAEDEDGGDGGGLTVIVRRFTDPPDDEGAREPFNGGGASAPT